MDETMLTLKAGVTLIGKGSQVGLMLKGLVQFAKDARQAEILRVLLLKSQSPESLAVLLHTGNGPPANEISLAIAEFILDFGTYLET